MEVAHLIKELKSLVWRADDVLDWASDLLNLFWKDGGANESLARFLESLQYPSPSVTRTAELHSWKLHQTCEWELTLNQFLPFLGESRKASENIHNHTRAFTTLCIVGEYKQDFFHVFEPLPRYRDGDYWLGRICRYSGPTMQPGRLWVMDADTLHALTDFQPDTLTLVVYGPIVRDEIICFNQISGRVEKRRTVGSAKQRLIEMLRRT